MLTRMSCLTHGTGDGCHANTKVKTSTPFLCVYESSTIKLAVPDSGVGIEQWSQSSGSNVIPRRAGPGLAGLRPHKIAAPQAHPTRSGLSKSRDAGDSRVKCLVFSI